MKIDKKNEANATNLGDLSEKKPLIEENRLRTLQRNTKKWKYTLSGLALFILIMGSVAVYFLSQQDQDIRQQASSIENSNISSKTNPPTSPQPKTDTISWDECVKAADSRILQTYPSICVHPDGRRATNTLPSTQPVKENFIQQIITNVTSLYSRVYNFFSIN
ncbi:MAG: hypothetical protein HN679_00605 [Candidatus Pacebacteria bacterium]|nr:hypothetical protein [Candidatus Paceibacterota bacterium]